MKVEYGQFKADELKKTYPNSFFFDEYDAAIMGVSFEGDKERIVYHSEDLIHITMEWNKDDFKGDLKKDEGIPAWNDFYDQASETVSQMISEAESEKNPPVIFYQISK